MDNVKIDVFVVNFLMTASSLDDILDILSNICKQLDINYLNSKNKQYKYFSFTFFGLISRTKTLLNLLLERIDAFKENSKEFSDIHTKLTKIEIALRNVEKLIKVNRIKEANQKIIETAEKYHKLFKKIKKTINPEI